MVFNQAARATSQDERTLVLEVITNLWWLEGISERLLELI